MSTFRVDSNVPRMAKSTFSRLSSPQPTFNVDPLQLSSRRGDGPLLGRLASCFKSFLSCLFFALVKREPRLSESCTCSRTPLALLHSNDKDETFQGIKTDGNSIMGRLGSEAVFHSFNSKDAAKIVSSDDIQRVSRVTTWNHFTMFFFRGPTKSHEGFELFQMIPFLRFHKTVRFLSASQPRKPFCAAQSSTVVGNGEESSVEVHLDLESFCSFAASKKFVAQKRGWRQLRAFVLTCWTEQSELRHFERKGRQRNLPRLPWTTANRHHLRLFVLEHNQHRRDVTCLSIKEPIKGIFSQSLTKSRG